ncbi:MAG TPA: hypothetical protein VFO16_15430 [Pseudonocardiaceae bacterium]|nr:hypothetical protein [Pseudonocardiaceae bacterium]
MSDPTVPGLRGAAPRGSTLGSRLEGEAERSGVLDVLLADSMCPDNRVEIEAVEAAEYSRKPLLRD